MAPPRPGRPHRARARTDVPRRRRLPSPGGRGWSAGPGGRSRPGAPQSCCGSSSSHSRPDRPPPRTARLGRLRCRARPLPPGRDWRGGSRRWRRPLPPPAEAEPGGAERGARPPPSLPPAGRAEGARGGGAAESEGGPSRQQARQPAGVREPGRFPSGGMLKIPNSVFLKTSRLFPEVFAAAFPRLSALSREAAGEGRACGTAGTAARSDPAAGRGAGRERQCPRDCGGEKRQGRAASAVARRVTNVRQNSEK